MLATIELAIGNAEGVAGEHRLTERVVHGDVMPGMTRRIQYLQPARAQMQHMALGRLLDALAGDRHDFAIDPLRGLQPIDRHRAVPQLARVGHVPRTARMHDQSCVRALLHQRTGTTGMIQMDMRQDHPVERLRRQVQLFQRRENARQRVAGGGVDHRSPPFMHDQMDGHHFVAIHAGIQQPDAVAVMV